MKPSRLEGKRVIVTRAAEMADELSELLKEEGALPIEIATIAIVPPADFQEIDRAIADLGQYQMVVFTSRNAVRFFGARLREKGVLRLPESMDVAAIGGKTALALKELGVEHPIVPKEAGAAEELVSELCARHRSFKDLAVLLPRAEMGREVLPLALRAKGARVDVVTVYRTVPVPDAASKVRLVVESEKIDWITFVSASAVEGFFGRRGGEALKESLARSGTKIAALGRIVAKALEEHGISVEAQPTVPSVEAMVEAMKQLG